MFFLFILTVLKVSADEPRFLSELFNKGTLIYSDDFEQGFDLERWQPRTKKWEVKNGQLIGIPSYLNAKEAEKALGRDHHLGLGPVIRLEKLPQSFVCHIRFMYEGLAYTAARPKLDIGHHINNLFFRKGGYTLKLSEGTVFENTKSGFELNEWMDLIIEFKPGKLLLNLNGQQAIYEHKEVNLKSRDEITFKALEASDSRLLFDFVRIWKGSL